VTRKRPASKSRLPLAVVAVVVAAGVALAAFLLLRRDEFGGKRLELAGVVRVSSPLLLQPGLETTGVDRHQQRHAKARGERDAYRPGGRQNSNEPNTRPGRQRARAGDDGQVPAALEQAATEGGAVVYGGKRRPETKLTERFELTPDGNLRLTYTWEDPGLYVRPHTYEYVFEPLPEDSYALETWCDSSDPLQRQSIVPPKQLP